MNYYIDAHHRREKEGNDRESSLNVARLLNYMGDSYRGLQDLEKALKCYEDCSKIQQKYLVVDHCDRRRLSDKIDQVIWQISSEESKSLKKNSSMNQSALNIRSVEVHDKVRCHTRCQSQ